MKNTLALVVLGSLVAATGLAQNRQWIPAGTNDWNVATNWSGGAVPTSANPVFINNGQTAFLATNGAGQAIYVGQGAGNGNLEVRSNAVLSASPFISLGRDSSRGGTLTVSGGTINADQLFVGDGGTTSTGFGFFTMTSGSVTITNQFTIGENTNSSGTATVNGGTISSASLRVGNRGAGTMVVNSNAIVTVTGTEVLIASNSSANSVLNVTGGGALNASNAVIRVGGLGSGTGGFGLFGTGTLNAAGVLVAGNSTFSDLGGTINITGGITNNGTWSFSPDTALTRSYSMVGSGSVTKNGAGVLTLAATNGYTGDTILNVANIRLGIANAISTNSVFRFGAVNQGRRLVLEGYDQTLAGVDSTGASGILIIEAAADNVSNEAATLTLNVAANTNYTFSGYLRDAAGTAVNSALSLVKNGAGTQVLSGASGNVTHSGNTTINAGVLEFAGANSVANNSAITLGGGTVRFSGGGTRSNTISGTGNLEKTGANTVTLSGNNTYTGTTTVSAGSLIVNGNQSAATGLLNVSAGATLGGTGTIGAATTISGIHSPGNSAGVQTFADGLTYATGSTFEWELFGNSASGRGTSFDGVDVTGGTLTIQSGVTSSLIFNASGSTVLWADGFWDSNQSWLVFDDANAPSILGSPAINIGFDSLGNDFAVARAGSSFEWDLQGNDLYLNYVIPEPSTYTLLALAAAGLGAHVVRRRRSR